MGMSISSARVPSAYQSTGSSGLQQRRQEFQALGKALQSGDLQGAQQAFAALAPKAQNGPQQAQGGNSPISQLGQALQSGDLAAAQKAFSAIGGHGRHHHQAASPSPAAPTNAASGTIGTNINVSA